MASHIYALRRKDLLADIKKAHPDTDGYVLLFAGFEHDGCRFVQESSFYYFTGITEPAVVLLMHLDGRSELYLPNCMQERAKWVVKPLQATDEQAKRLGVDRIHLLGTSCAGYQMHPFFPESEYNHLLERLKEQASQGKTMFTLAPTTPSGYVEQRLVLGRIKQFGINSEIVDISATVARMRRSKDMHEIEQLYKAVAITSLAQEAAAKSIGDGVNEAEVQASLEYIITGSQATCSFASIVASGAHAAVLHYDENNEAMQHGDLVVVDIGARYNYYCADITRTYPVSGTFSDRQKEIYTIVLETQEYIAECAKPGMWLSNADHPEASLNHLARAFLSKKGYGAYFPHGIGHFLGLDVHDVGSYKEPLKEGDVVTIEPGIYIPKECIGVRIEDNYWIVKEGNICLSEDLPKDVASIERMVQEKFSE